VDTKKPNERRRAGSGVGAMGNRYLGKYRGIVTDNRDPRMIGRIRARVPDVLGIVQSAWALPCAPCDVMGRLAVPEAGASVWIEFEHGDVGYPIWTGCFWSDPSEVTIAPTGTLLVRTKGGHTVRIDDSPGTGGITLEAATGERISLTASGIEIDNGKGARIELRGPQVSINGDALEVT
jgi:hypothetical protein